MWVDLVILWCLLVLSILLGYLQKTPWEKYCIRGTVMLVSTSICIVTYLSFRTPAVDESCWSALIYHANYAWV